MERKFICRYRRLQAALYEHGDELLAAGIVKVMTLARGKRLTTVMKTYVSKNSTLRAWFQFSIESAGFFFLSRAQGEKASLMCIGFQLKLKVDLTKFFHLAVFVSISVKRTIGTDTALPAFSHSDGARLLT